MTRATLSLRSSARLSPLSHSRFLVLEKDFSGLKAFWKIIRVCVSELGEIMKSANEINYSKLLGFESVGDLIGGKVDFQDEAIAAKLGAKIGLDPNAPAEPREAPKK